MESQDREDLSQSLDRSRSKTPAEILKEKKQKLRQDIQELKELNFQIESSMNISKFGDIKHLLKAPEPDPHLRSTRIPDVETEYADDLFKLVGTRCTKFSENEYVFSFYPSGNIISSSNAYAVQITEASEKPAIGKWVMPMSVDIGRILSETPLDTAMDLKPFLANCKHYIDCYTNRVRQYEELRSIVEDLSGCWLDSRSGHTIITLKFLDIRDSESEESYNILLYLIYESNRVRPHKLKIDPLDKKKLDDATLNKFKTYFKYFKCYNLKKAFEETVAGKHGTIVWNTNPNTLDLSDSSASSSEVNFSTQIGKKSKRSRRGRKRKVVETSRHSQESENEEQRSEELNSEREDDPGLASLSLGNQSGEKRVKKKGKAQAARKKPTKAAGAEVPKGKSKPKKNSENTRKSNINKTNTNLRQSTLAFKDGGSQLQKPRNAEDPPRSESAPSVGVSAAKQKSKPDDTLLVNREFGTSTPVPNLLRQKKRFAVDRSTEVSPIKTKSGGNLSKKQPSKITE